MQRVIFLVCNNIIHYYIILWLPPKYYGYPYVIYVTIINIDVIYYYTSK